MTKKAPIKTPEKSINDKSKPELQEKRKYKEKKQGRRTNFEKEKESEATRIIKRKL
ncbi:MAG: hypothetical protein J0H47_08990 [Gammaproteobacteria bacterium]|nr:hypothetical protein [Gammaproteobacteria bacterium]